MYIPDKQLYEKGRLALQYFHNEMAIRFPSTYKITLSQLITYLEKQKGGKAFLEGFGLAIQNTDMSIYRQNESMKDLAKLSNGKIPTNGSFYKALQDEMGSLSFSDYGEISLQIAKDVVEKSAKVGEKVINTADALGNSAVSIAGNLSWILPVLLIGGAGLYIYGMKKA